MKINKLKERSFYIEYKNAILQLKLFSVNFAILKINIYCSSFDDLPFLNQTWSMNVIDPQKYKASLKKSLKTNKSTQSTINEDK